MSHNDFKVGVYSQIPRPMPETEIHKSHPNIMRKILNMWTNTCFPRKINKQAHQKILMQMALASICFKCIRIDPLTAEI